MTFTGSQRTSWFSEARMGMFIHWGLFSQTQGYWNGNPYFGAVEYLAQVFRVPNNEYARLADEFNPVHFDAVAWARAAKQAGFRYIVVTSKHHEGFAMFKSRDPFNVVDGSPYGSDPMAALAEAARAEGLKFGFYYSQFLDWRDPDAGGNDWDFPVEGRDFEAYMERKALPQVEELLTNYGKIDLLWYDIPGTISLEHSQRFVDRARELQPEILINSRIGNGLGDFQTFGDNELPPPGLADRPWEAIFTHNHSWGFTAHDFTFKSSNELLETLVTTISRGGNCMINVGPQPDGRFPQPTATDFARMGDWMSLNSESIYGAGRANLGPVPWGVVTAKQGRVFLHILRRPDDDVLILPGAAALSPGKARFLADSRPVDYVRDGDDLRITAPASESPVGHEVIELELTIPDTPQNGVLVLSQHGPELTLEPPNARLSPGVEHHRVSGWSYFARVNYFASLKGLRAPEDWVAWDVRFLDPGIYWVEIEYAAGREQADRVAQLTIGDQVFPISVLETGVVDPYRVTPFTRQPLGRLVIERPGVRRVELRPVAVVPGGYQLSRRPVARDDELFTFKALTISRFERLDG